MTDTVDIDALVGRAYAVANCEHDDTADLLKELADALAALKARVEMLEVTARRVVAINDWNHDTDRAARIEFENAAEQCRAALEDRP